MYRFPARRLALAATGATLLVAVPASTANSAVLSGPLGTLTCSSLTAVDTLVAGALTALVPGADVPEALAAWCIDTPGELGAVLEAASPDQVDQVLAALPPEVTGPAVATLDPAALAALAQGLSPAQVQALLGYAGALGDLDALLFEFAGLVSGSASESDELAALYVTVMGLVAQQPGASAPGALALLNAIGLTYGVAPVLGGPASPSPAPSPSPSPSPGAVPSPTTSPASPAPAVRSTAYRALVHRVSLSRSRRVARARISCPAGTDGCIVAVTRRARGRASKAPRWLGLAAGERVTVRLKVPARAARKLRRRGGKVQVTAATAYSSLPPVTRAKRVKPRRR